MADLNDDYRDLLRLFSEHGVEYVLVGAYAVALHGVPRATGDIDLFIRANPSNATKVMAALKSFGAPLGAASVTEADFAKPGVTYQLGVAPRRIDVITELTGVSFEQAIASRIVKAWSGLEVPFIGLELLIANKRATGRAKDLADVERLEALAPKHAR